ncbi:conserved membrane hypothetical protein [Vibrio chagasii]|nr:conserved membrane hypothetical protein [Vibrio chagasii]CAH6867860.1 conserved membrane hypothetical protein [Vibrio chagasii]CAH7052103.1 conserved membrane hypothetical protein [Vibrio chagasii]CAH7113246.1 conserved membrane hypothetical protein [Vibrio chagasii]CAH7303446.1 conserved membrane hypothetical protein [Vibrio chagasii]
MHKSDLREGVIASSIIVMMTFNSFGVYYYTSMGKIIYLLSHVIAAFYVYGNYRLIKVDRTEVILFISLFFVFISFDIKYFLGNLLTSYPSILLMFFIGKINPRITEKTILYLCILLSIGFLLFLMNLIVDYNVFSIRKSNVGDERVWGCFLLTCNSQNVYRYSFIFEEPGTLASIVCLMITFLPSDMNKLKRVFILIGATTYSLFFYIYFILYLFFKNITMLRIIIMSIFILLLFFKLESFLVSIDNKYTNFYILRRLEFVDGNLVGFINNRTDDLFLSFYNDFPLLDKIIGIHLPVSSVYSGWTGLTYRTFVIEYGWLSILIPFSLLCRLVIINLGFKKLVLFCLFFVCFFYQRPLFFRAEYLGLFLMLTSLCKLRIKNGGEDANIMRRRQILLHKHS